jgi:hypothetical protein
MLYDMLYIIYICYMLHAMHYALCVQRVGGCGCGGGATSVI